MLAPPISTVGTTIKTMPATNRDCGLMLPLSYLTRPREEAIRVLLCPLRLC